MAARKATLVAASGTTYIASVYLTYLFFLKDNDETSNTINQNTGSCPGCFSYVTDPLRTQKFQKIAHAYDDEISKDELVMGINLLRRSLLYFHAKGDVLEVGAGTARNLDYYPKKQVSKVILSDTSDKMLRQAVEKVNGMPNNQTYETLVLDAADLSRYEDDSFDTIVDTFGLCSFDDPVSVLMELSRVCRPEGKILLLEHGRTKKYEGLSGYLDKYAERHAKNWGCVWNRDIDDILERSGLKVEVLDTWHFGTTYYAVCRPGVARIKEEKKLDCDTERPDERLEEGKGTTVSGDGKSWWRLFGLGRGS